MKKNERTYLHKVMNEPAMLSIRQLQSVNSSDSQRASTQRSSTNTGLHSLTEFPPQYVSNVNIRQQATPLVIGEPPKAKTRNKMLPYKQYLTLMQSQRKVP